MNIVLKACNVNLRIIIVSIICYFTSHSLTLTFTLILTLTLTLIINLTFTLILILAFTFSHAYTRMYARTHVTLYLSISFAIFIVLRTKISLSTLCLLKDEISHLLNPLLKLPNKIELIVSSFFSPFGYLLRRFPRNCTLA